jgi:hypothetical protein
MNDNFERGMFRIPEKYQEALEKGPVEQFEEIDIEAVQLKKAEKAALNQEFLRANREKMQDFEYFMEVGKMLEAYREKKLRMDAEMNEGQERRLNHAA